MTHQYFSSMRGFCNNNNHHDLFFGSSQVEMESYHESSKNSTFVRLHQKDNSQQVVQSRNSKLVRAAQELLCEFCSLAGEGSGYDGYDAKKKKKMKKKKEVEEEGVNKDASWNQSFCSMDVMQLQKIKAKLLAMLEEIDKRYTKYCHQMRNVAMPFEAVAGEDAAKVYCSLASEAMSRHFRCLRDGVSGQLRALKRAAGEEDARVDRKSSSAAGTTLGETPRLKLLDQRMRQHKALRQGLQLVEQPPWRLQRGLPDRAVAVLRAWLFEHFLHPYPNDVDKHILARQSGLSKSQVSNWFINARVRLWKPMIEEMYMQEVKVVELQNPNHHSTLEATMDCQNPNSDPIIFDQKPTAPPRQLVVSDMVRVVDGLDLHPKYSERSRVGSNVSLSLGLQQHSGGGVSLSLLPSSSSSSSLLLLPHIVGHEDQRVQFSILDEEEGERQLPFMNLMGAQLLHDLAR